MNVTIQDLLDAGVHFGHQLRRFNPKSKKYIFDNRNGVSIIDLEKTFAQLEAAFAFVKETTANGKDVLIVGTKKQAQDIVREAATASGMPFAANRWLGGTLTNYATVKASIAKFKRYQGLETSGELAKMHAKEAAAIKREMARMQRNFEGIVNMDEMPGAVIVIDTATEAIAVNEARRLGLPIVALVDTNSDPTIVTYPIPGNDDSTKSIRVVVDALVQAIQEGVAERPARNTVRIPASEQPAVAKDEEPRKRSPRGDRPRREGGDKPRGTRGGPRTPRPAKEADDSVPTTFSTPE